MPELQSNSCLIIFVFRKRKYEISCCHTCTSTKTSSRFIRDEEMEGGGGGGGGGGYLSSHSLSVTADYNMSR